MFRSAVVSRLVKPFGYLFLSAILVLSILLFVVIARSGKKQRLTNSPTSFATARVQENYGKLPLHFEANHGQVQSQVKFLTRGKGYSIALTPQTAVLELQNERAATVEMKLKGANANPRISSSEPLEAKMNYFIGDDPKQWKTDVPTFAKVKYEQVYPGTDVVYYGNQQQLEYDFIVAPHADPQAIKLEFDGINALRLDEAGNLLLATDAGEVKQHKPIVYQEVAGIRHEIAGSYRIQQNEVGFEIGEYDRCLPLVIDPVVSYATLVSSFGVNSNAIAVDASGNAYLAGWVTPTNGVTTPGALKSSTDGVPSNSVYGFVAKFNNTGTKLLYAAMIGGSAPVSYGRDCDPQNPDKGQCTQNILDSRFNGIAVDARGAAYLTGTTTSTNFPTTPGAVQATYRYSVSVPNGTTTATAPSTAAFAIKLNQTGNGLVYSTLLGNASEGRAIAIEATGQAVVTGSTSDDIPLKDAFQTRRRGGNDAFVAKLNATGTELIYGTYIGSEGNDKGLGIATDQEGNAYITGETNNGGGLGDRPRGTRFPTTRGAFRTSEGELEGIYIAKFDPRGNLVYSTLIEGAEPSQNITQGIAVDSAGCAYVTAVAFNDTYPTTPGAFQPKNSSDCRRCELDTVVSKLSADGSSLVYSTYFGRKEVTDKPGGIAVDADGNAYFANRKQYLDTNGVLVSDTLVVKLNPQGNEVSYSLNVPNCQTFGLALDSAANVYLTGAANSGFAPTPNAYWTYGQGAFVAKITEVVPPRASSYSLSGTVTFRNGPPPYATYEGVKILLQGTVSRTATTDVNGRYVFDRLPAGGTYYVLPDPMSHSSLPKISGVRNLSASQVFNFEVRDYKSRYVANVSAASYNSGSLAPESIVSAFGSNLTTRTQAATSLPLPTDLSGVKVAVTDSVGTERQAALFFVSPTQVNYVLPPELASGPAIVYVTGADGSTATELIQIDSTNPGLFSADSSGRGVAAANLQRVKANGVQSNETIVQFDVTRGQLMPIPIDLGAAGDKVYLALFGTGVRNRRDLTNVSATVGGVSAAVTYAGSQNSFVGVDQINVMIPRELAGRGEVDVVLNVEGKPANVVKVKIK